MLFTGLRVSIIATLAMTAGAAHGATLQIDHDAEGRFDRSFDWSIATSVNPPTADLHPGDTQTYAYSVSLTKSPPSDSNHRVAGQVRIANPHAEAAQIESIGGHYAGSAFAIDCGGFAPPAALAAGATLDCSYEVGVADAAAHTSTVQVVTAGAIGGGSADAQVAFAPQSVLHDSVTVVSGDLDGSWSFDASQTRSYEVERACVDHQSHKLTHTAAIVELGKSAFTKANLYCHVLRAQKTADITASRYWHWSIDKQHDEDPPLLLTGGQTYVVPYRIDVATAGYDEDIGVSGIVSVWNGNPVKTAHLASLSDVLEGFGPIPLDCPPLVIPPLGTVQCTYSAPFPDVPVCQNVATAIQTNFHYGIDGSATPNGNTREYVAHAKLYVDDADRREVDACVDVEDVYLGVTYPLGTVCADASPAVLGFDGPIHVAAHAACEFTVHNLARYIARDSGASGTASTTLDVERADCDPVTGCVLTQGYWRTHSARGPAPYDATWALIGEATPFFLAKDDTGTTLSWHDVMTTPPRGNAYFNLATQFVAATLNTLNGAGASEQVLDALAEAQALFEAHTVQQIGALRGNQAPRPRFIELAGLLDMYNKGEGDIGPPSCSEN